MNENTFNSIYHEHIESNRNSYTGHMALHRHGTGSINYPNSKSLHGLWQYDVFVQSDDNKITYQTGDVYFGHLEIDDNDVYPDGNGIMKYVGGSLYEGEWRDEYHCGKGKFTFDNSSNIMSIEGIWDDDELLDDCDHEIKYKNGNVYIGEAFIYNANIDNLCPDGIRTLTFNCSNSNTVFPKFEVFQIIGTWQEGYIASDYDHKVIYKTGEIYIGKVNEYNVNNGNNTIFPNGRGKMIFNCIDSIILNIIGTWEYGSIVNIEKIVYNTEKIEARSDLNYSIREAGYLPFTDEKFVLGKWFRKAGQNFNERNGIV